MNASVEALCSQLSQMRPSQYNKAIDLQLVYCYENDNIDHQALAYVSALQLILQLNTQGVQRFDVSNADTVIECISRNKLWFYFLEKTINVHPTMEAILGYLRKSIVCKGEEDLDFVNSHIDLICALAQQCKNHDYIIDADEAEQSLLEDILHRSAQKIDAEENLSDDTFHCVLLASLYRPLFSVLSEIEFKLDSNKANRLNKVFRESFSGRKRADSFERLIDSTFLQVLEEKALIAGLLDDASECDFCSQTVRAQYEKNPYPRWRALPTKRSTSLISRIQHLPGLNRPSFELDSSARPLKVLVAGCGTGYEPIDLAQSDASLQIDAIDLSANSLAYGQRMAKAMSLESIKFSQKNILSLDESPERYDLVTSTGVIHHMQSPAKALHCLSNVCREGGLIRLGLYSKAARQRVSLAHQLIREHGLSNSDEDIRRFRRSLIASKGSTALTDLLQSEDFYSLSACRDLLFHEHEIQFDLTEVKQLIAEQGLVFIGFDLPHPAILKAFKAMFPSPSAELDLLNWHGFEQRHPDVFIGMYQFYLQKV